LTQQQDAFLEQQDAFVQPAFLDPRKFGIQKGFEAVFAFFAWLSARNSPDRRAILSFSAREFGNEKGVLKPDVYVLNRQQVGSVCDKLGDVQTATDDAVKKVLSTRGYLPPAPFGTAVHVAIKKKINEPRNPDFRAEVSYVKGMEENRDNIRYGMKGSIRVDVFENTKSGDVCVYDIKTGRRGLSALRMFEIAIMVSLFYPGARRIIVTEVRPTPWMFPRR
jgi:hypothetical protein